MATAQDPQGEIRVPLENRWQRTFLGAGLIGALAIGAALGAYGMSPDTRVFMLLPAAALGACFIYVLWSAPRIRTFPDYAITFRPRTIRFPAYPLWQHRHHELVYADIDRIDEVYGNVPWILLTTRQGQFRIAIDLLPPEWTSQRIAELITKRKTASRG